MSRTLKFTSGLLAANSLVHDSTATDESPTAVGVADALAALSGCKAQRLAGQVEVREPVIARLEDAREGEDLPMVTGHSATIA
jgi:hypothetical protein